MNCFKPRKTISIRMAVLCILTFGFFSTLAQTEPATQGESKVKFADKIGHWLAAYGMSSADFMPEKRHEFKAKAYAEVYIEGIIEHDAWMFNLLNRVTKYRYETKQEPHILFEVKFKPSDETLTKYTVSLNVQATGQVSVNIQKIATDAAASLNGKTYAEPILAAEDVEKVIGLALDELAEKLGNELAPNLMVRYNNEVFWNGHEIPILEEEGNSLELEAIDKDGNLLTPSDLKWTNADKFESRGIVDMTGINSKEVTLTKAGERNPLKVTVKRVNTTDDINELLKMLIVEVLTTKKKEAVDTLPLLRQDSIRNANDILAKLAAIEKENYQMEVNGNLSSAIFETPILLTGRDTIIFNANEVRKDGLMFLKKRKRIHSFIRKKVNVVALADLVVDHPEKVEILLQDLLKNSGRLIARLILQKDSQGKKDAARNIVVDFFNQNIERIAGNQFPQPVSPPVLPAPKLDGTIANFKAGEVLYLSPMVDFEGKTEFVNEIEAYLKGQSEPIFVTINYSQDVSTESFLKRSSAGRPKGLPSNYRFIAITLVNIPGSILANLTATTEQGAGTRPTESIEGASLKQLLAATVRANVPPRIHVGLELFNPLAVNGAPHTFLNPAGGLITLPNETTQVVFSTYDRFFTNSFQAAGVSPAIGSLVAFIIGADTYTAVSSKGNFNGYAKLIDGTISNTYYEDVLTALHQPSTGIALIPSIEGGNFVGYAAKFQPRNGDGSTLVEDLFISGLTSTELTKSVVEYLAEKRKGEYLKITELTYIIDKPFEIINSQTGLRADTYLKSVIDENSPLSVILAHCALVYQKPEAISAFKACESSNQTLLMAQIKMAFDQQVQRNSELPTYVPGPTGGIVTKSLVDELSDRMVNVALTSLMQLQNGEALTEAITKAKNIYEIKDAISNYYSPCSFRALNATTRINIINSLLNSDEDNWTIDDRNVLFDLIIYTPDDQIVSILKKFYDDGKYSSLYTLWSEGEEEYRSDVVDLLITKLVPNFNSVGITLTPDETIAFEDFEQYDEFDLYAGHKPYFIGLENESTYQITQNYQVTLGVYSNSGTVEFSDNGRIRFKQNYWLKDTETKFLNADALYRKDPKSFEEVDFEVGAFEPVTIYFTRNYPTLGVELGKPYLMPAIWALRMSESVEDVEFHENLRTVVNVAAIAFALESGGASLSFGSFLTTMGGVVSAADLELQSNLKTMSPSEYQANIEYFEAWDNFYMAATVADGLYATSRIVTIKGIASKWNRFNTLIKTRGAIPNMLRTAWGRVKAFSSTSVASSNLLSNLTGHLAEFRDVMISQGISAEILANSILFRNAANETVAIIANGKITPVKWKPYYEFTSKIETEAGYWILKYRDDVFIDLGFKSQRTIKATEANDYLVNSGRAQKEGQPYLVGKEVEEIVLTEGEYVYFVENFNGGLANPGGFGTKDLITTIEELRQKLAVLEEWKQTGLIPTIRKYRVISPMRTRSGMIGPQLEKTGINKGKIYPGGGHQYEIVESLRNGNWTKFLEEVPGSARKLSPFNGTVNSKLDELAISEAFHKDFSAASAETIQLINQHPGWVDAWKKLFNEGNAASDALRKDTKVLDWVSKQGNNIRQGALDDLVTNLDGKTIQRTFEDGQGRLVALTESTGATRAVVTVEKTVSGEIKSFKYTQAYNKAGQSGMPPVSANGLAPDFSGNPKWLYPATGDQKNIVKVRLSGKRKGTDGDFHRANQEAGFSGTTAPEGYTWHHLDDFDPVTGESTMQLVKTSDHVGTLPHTGSVKQFENYTGATYAD